MIHTLLELPVRVELLSDMCCGTGEDIGRHLDNVTATDDLGLPIVPGKRLKGLLRSCAQILVDGGFVKQGVLKGLFGGFGGQRGRLEVTTAELEDASVYKSGLLGRTPPYLPAQVTKVFTATRSHTAITTEGIAKNHSLRTNQIVSSTVEDKPISFRFYVRVIDPKLEEIKLLTASISTLRHIGLNKSRGYGEVRCVYEPAIQQITEDAQPPRKWDDKLTIRNCLDFSGIKLTGTGCQQTVPYTIALQQDIVVSGQVDQYCFSGSVLMGALARHTSNEPWFKDVILKGAIFSNAYPLAFDDAGERLSCYPIPFSFLKEKNAGIGAQAPALRAYSLVDGFLHNRGCQYEAVKGCGNWYTGQLMQAKVATAYSFHNATPASEQGKQYFSLCTVKAGQMFSGTITGDTGVIEVLQHVVTALGGQVTLGASASAQFGNAILEISGSPAPEWDTPICLEGDIVAECLADVILIDEQGQNTTEPKALLAALGKALDMGTADFDVAGCKIFSKVITTGGYNAKWKLHRRQFKAFQKGTCVLLPGCSAKSLSNPYLRLGAQTNEGYGLVRLRTVRAGLGSGADIKPCNCLAPVERGNGASGGNAFAWLETIIRLNSARAEAATLAANTDAKTLSFKSKSSAMRISAAYRAVLTNTEVNTESLKTQFSNYISVNFPNDEKNDENLAEICLEHIINKFDKWLDDTSIIGFSTSQINTLFITYMQGFIRVLKLWKTEIDEAPLVAESDGQPPATEGGREQ